MIHDDNAVTRLAAAVTRIAAHEFPVQVTDTVRRFMEDVADISGLDIDPDDPEPGLAKLGTMSRMIGATIRNTANPTMLGAGYKSNVIPGSAEATIDTRFLPGREDELLAKIDELAGEGITRETIVHDIAVETSFDGDVVDAMAAALRAEDAGARPVPYLMSGGTDAKSFSLLGIRCFGFAPLQLPADLDFMSLFHGIDERVPVDALHFGVRVLDRFLSNC
jgi:acetylornithine deacetylase/succinyl-diaminopimelate desuccinylase-like protein